MMGRLKPVVDEQLQISDSYERTASFLSTLTPFGDKYTGEEFDKITAARKLLLHGACFKDNQVTLNIDAVFSISEYLQ